MDLHFLEASQPLTKSYALAADGSINKTSYPLTWEFTSHVVAITTIDKMHAAITKHAKLGHCLLKGTIQRPLVCESRAGSTDSNASTQWLVLDLDGLDPNVRVEGAQTSTFTLTLDTLLADLGLGDVSYVIQWSASYGIENQHLRAHVFMLLDRLMSAPLLKQWLIQMNHQVLGLKHSMRLTKTCNAISWALDISAAQNDKLIYIAPPTLGKGIKDPVPNNRIALMKRKKPHATLPAQINSPEANRVLTSARIDELRAAANLPKKKQVFKTHGHTEVLAKPDQATITEMKQDRGFVYFNLNGGDSWAYYHPESNPDYIYNFKGEPTYLTKELLPDYWNQILGTGARTGSDGVAYLAFCDRSTSVYWRGTYDQATDHLELFAAKNETQVRHFAKQNGLPLGDYIPEWDLSFDPNDNVRVDFQARTVNQFSPTKFMLHASTKKVSKVPTTIFKVMHHALGSDIDVIEHFLNWLAYIVQTRDRTKTAWIFHGTHGCLAGDTLVGYNRGMRNGARLLPIKQAYEKWTGTYRQGTGAGKTWDMTIPTRAKSALSPRHIGNNEVLSIVQSGVKQLWKLTTTCGRIIRVTAEHPFMRPDGSFTPLEQLSRGDEIMAEGLSVNCYSRGGRTQGRKVTHSIPNHPHGFQHIVAGKNYKRSNTARLIVEAEMNEMPLDAFIGILRNDPVRAAQLKYLSPGAVVHHSDEDLANEGPTNLEVTDKAAHDRMHAHENRIGYLRTRVTKVKSIKKDKIEMTYDMTMRDPHNNYVANGLVVHNTGKGILFSKVLRPMFGHHQTSAQNMTTLAEPYNHWMEKSFLVFIDEVQTDTLLNEAGVVAKLKNYITEDFIAVRAMYRGAAEVRNYCNFILASNMSSVIHIEPGDRRFNVAKYQPQRIDITDTELAAIDKEVQAFYDYLAQYPLDKSKAMAVLDTTDRRTMISISESSADTVSSALIDGDFKFFLDQLPNAHSAAPSSNLDRSKAEDYRAVLRAVAARTQAKTGMCSIARDELRVLYDYVVGGMPVSPNKFTALLKHHRIHISDVWVNHGATSGKERGIKTVWKDLKVLQEATI